MEKQRGQADHGGKSPAAYPLHWMIQLRLLSGAGKVLQKIFSMVKPHFFFICWDDNKKAEILSSNLRFNNYIGFWQHGGIAQLGERLNGIQEVSGSIPLISTT